MAPSKNEPTVPPRNGFYEAMKISRIPDGQNGSQDVVKRFTSHAPAWKPGAELPWSSINPKAYEKGNMVDFPPAAFGGHVYAQAPLAAARAVEEEDQGASNGTGKLGIHVSLCSLGERERVVKLTHFWASPSKAFSRGLAISTGHLCMK